MDFYGFYTGQEFEAYKYLGAHYTKERTTFRTFAPSAAGVELVLNGQGHGMQRVHDGNFYEITLDQVKEGDLYEFRIWHRDGSCQEHCDPYGFGMELRPAHKSVVRDLNRYAFTDEKWLKTRDGGLDKPLNIYEIHAGSWRCKPDEEDQKDVAEHWYNYRELAPMIVAYVKEMGYTHVELMPIMEHPFDASWGYQVTGYYAPTSRYGTAAEFMYFVNYMHKHGIGVILDWVPAHFPKDAHGLADFDGQALYEYADPRKGEHPDWGTKVFDYSRNEVSNFLIANALYWIEQYHIDGLRVDAVASMLYLDYGRTPGNWVPNQYGENKNLEAIEFFRHLNSVVNKQGHGAAVIAEESTAWPMVTGRPEDGGLGFKFKWNMGWMHDFLEYMKLDPYFRKYNHNRMTFSLTYFTSENYILVLSHDEVVHLKCSMINKMPGLGEDKFSNLKAGYTFMLGHPGKKLLFMGQDFGQWHEWDEKVSLDWYLAEEESHKKLQEYVRDLLHIYKKYPCLYQLDNDWNGFQWINANDGDRSIFSFIRKDETGKKNLLFVVNFTPVDRPDYRVGVPKRCKLSLLLDNVHGAYKPSQCPTYTSVKRECDGQPYSISYPLGGYGTAIFRF